MVSGMYASTQPPASLYLLSLRPLVKIDTRKFPQIWMVIGPGIQMVV
jgi:hypothetical protein